MLGPGYSLPDGGDIGSGGCLRFPYLTDQQSSEPAAPTDQRQTAGAESGGVVGQTARFEPGQKAEGCIKASDDERCGDRERTAGNRKFGDDPPCSRAEMVANARREGLDFGGGEAIKKKMGDDDIVSCAWASGGREVAGVGTVQGDRGPARRSLPSRLVNRRSIVGLRSITSARICGFWLSNRARNRPSPSPSTRACCASPNSGNAVEAAALEHGTKGKIFEPPVRPGYSVEVGSVEAGGSKSGAISSKPQGRSHQRGTASKRSGVSRAASAAMRRSKLSSRDRSRARNSRADTVQAR